MQTWRIQATFAEGCDFVWKSGKNEAGTTPSAAGTYTVIGAPALIYFVNPRTYCQDNGNEHKPDAQKMF
jgi:hypothetical protein